MLSINHQNKLWPTLGATFLTAWNPRVSDKEISLPPFFISYLLSTKQTRHDTGRDLAMARQPTCARAGDYPSSTGVA